MKTASRIVGTAAFRQGYVAQDSPLYGAERRGAPMVAFTRFDSQSILERGVVTAPELIVIADASLLDDPLVRPLQGLSPNGIVLLNVARLSQSMAAVEWQAHDFTGLALRHTGSASALSVALGAAAGTLAGLEAQYVEEAVRHELQQLKLDAPRIERNLELARACFAKMRIQAGPTRSLQMEVSQATCVIPPTYEGPWAGTASVSSRPNTGQRKTGDWRIMRPLIDPERCTHCWICFVNCPDGAIALSASEVPQIDYGVCKGCLICAEECPVDAITTAREADYEAS
jgi:pyruvate ferredoxin oxidoreductase gamma subunit